MRTPRLAWLGLLVATFFVVPTKASAQGPWTVTVTPTFNPLPIGFCGSVLITAFDGKDFARNPLGLRISMADFDMTVSGASVAGQYIDSSHWVVCACQGGTPGSMGTVIASYPAQALAENARVPGLAFQRTANFTLAAPKGTANPAACTAPAARPAPSATTFQQPVGPATPRSSPAPAPTPAPPVGVALPPTTPPVAVVLPPTVPPVGVALPPTAPPVTTAPADTGRGAATGRIVEPTPARGSLYVAGPVSVTLGLNAHGSWYEAAPVALNLSLSANGTWYEAAPVTMSLSLSASGAWYDAAPVAVTFDLRANGTWVESREPRPLQPSVPGR